MKKQGPSIALTMSGDHARIYKVSKANTTSPPTFEISIEKEH